MTLNTNTSVLSAIGNDFGYEFVFDRQIESLVAPVVVVGISTSFHWLLHTLSLSEPASQKKALKFVKLVIIVLMS